MATQHTKNLIFSNSPRTAVNQLKDSGLYVLEEQVPVFAPHQRMTANGVVLFEVTESDLDTICDNTNAMLGMYLPPLTVGHRCFDDNADEQMQPDIVGFTANYRVKNGFIVADLYRHKDFDGLFPYRSAEYSPDRKQILGVALLKRTPYLGLGTHIYQYHASGQIKPSLATLFPSLSRSLKKQVYFQPINPN